MSAAYPTDPACIFCRIIAGKAPANVRYESETAFAFDDIHPKAPTHVLICPKAHHPTFMETPSDVLADLSEEIKKVAAHLGFDERGFRLQVNNGRESGQIIFHLHYHFLAGRTMHDHGQ
jgi:histidine triad (HIT) family protein